jgi:hypothetical protein
MTSDGTSVQHTDAFEVTVDSSMRLREGEWDGGRARRELFAWASTGEETDLAKAARGFTVADVSSGLRENCKLPVAYVENGELVGIGNGIRAALARLPITDEELRALAESSGVPYETIKSMSGAQEDGLSDEVRARAKTVLQEMLARLNSQTADSIAHCMGVSSKVSAKIVAENDARMRADAFAADGHAPRADDQQGRVYRWSRTSLVLDAKQKAAVERAAAAGEAEARRSRGDWRQRTSPARVDGAAWRAAAESLRADGFADYLTCDGFLKLKVWAARTGVQYYSDGVRTWGEYRSIEEVGHDESLESWGLKPITDDHPPELVVPDNYTKYARGSCGQDAKLAMPAADGHRYVELTILVGDLATLLKIRDGKLELSAGYTTIAVASNGRDFDGAEYEFIQTKIRINHLAIVEEGRAGPLARIKLDGAAWEVLPATPATPRMETTDMKLSKTHLALLLHDAKSMTDGLTTEAATLIAELVKYALMGEQPPPEMLAKLAAALQMGAEEMGMEEVSEIELADGLRVSMTDSQAAAWTKVKEAPDAAAKKLQADEAAAKKAAKEAADRAKLAEDKAEAAAKVAADAASDPEKAKLANLVSDQAGQILGLRRIVDSLEQSRVADTKKALILDVSSICPDLVKRWATDGGAPVGTKQDLIVDFAMRGTADLSLADMKAKVLVDMDPGCKADLDDARKQHESTFDSFVGSLYRTQVAGAKERKAALDSRASTPTDTHIQIDSQSLSAAIAKSAYGVGV